MTVMADEPDNLILAYMPKFDEKLDRVAVDVREIKGRVTNLEIVVGTLATAHVQVFGRRHHGLIHTARRPASEKRQGTKSRGGSRIGRCRELSYGDLAVRGPQLRSAARVGWAMWMGLQAGCGAFF
jgi:hypothetical protein